MSSGQALKPPPLPHALLWRTTLWMCFIASGTIMAVGMCGRLGSEHQVSNPEVLDEIAVLIAGVIALGCAVYLAIAAGTDVATATTAYLACGGPDCPLEVEQEALFAVDMTAIGEVFTFGSEAMLGGTAVCIVLWLPFQAALAQSPVSVVPTVIYAFFTILFIAGSTVSLWWAFKRLATAQHTKDGPPQEAACEGAPPRPRRYSRVESWVSASSGLIVGVVVGAFAAWQIVTWITRLSPAFRPVISIYISFLFVATLLFLVPFLVSVATWWAARRTGGAPVADVPDH